jgi:hypothetical protein
MLLLNLCNELGRFWEGQYAQDALLLGSPGFSHDDAVAERRCRVYTFALMVSMIRDEVWESLKIVSKVCEGYRVIV